MKWLWYLKYLKLFLIGLWISCFMGLGVNSVNAWTVNIVGLDKFTSEYDSNYKIWFLKWGAVLSEFLWQWKSLAALNWNTFFWWASNWQPYFYSNWNFQGFFGEYWSCDEITWSVYSPSWCSSLPITWDYKTVFKSFFGKVVAWDFAYYDYSNYDSSTANGYTHRHIAQFCWSSHEIWKSLCFRYADCRISQWSACNWLNFWSMVDSQSLSDLTFANIPLSYLSYAPWQAGYDWGWNIDGWSQNIDNLWTLTGDTVNVDCKKSLAFQWYRANGYKTRMCYSSYWNTDDLYTWPWDAAWYALTWVNIEDVWFNTAWYRRNWSTWTSMAYSDWFDYWRKTYEVHKNNPEHTNPFLWVPVAIFTLMWNVESYALPYSNASILEFCDLSLFTADYSAPYTWIAQNVVCNLSAIDIVEINAINGSNPDDGLPWYWDSYYSWRNWTIWSSWEGITNREGFSTIPWIWSWQAEELSWLNVYTDWKTFQNNIFNLLKSSFKYVGGSWTSSSPLLPSYIIIALCWIVLFRFISH